MGDLSNRNGGQTSKIRCLTNRTGGVNDKKWEVSPKNDDVNPGMRRRRENQASNMEPPLR